MVVLRAALYPRVSTEEQAKHGASIKAQIDSLLEYCAEKKMKIVDIYNDEGQSGGKPALRRPAMKRLLEDVEAGKIDIILFTKLDRWFRNIQEYYKVQEILDKHGVKWEAIHEDYEIRTAAGQFKVNIMLSVAQAERQKGAERVKDVLENKRKNKEACFGGPHPPFGYIKQPDEDGIMRLVKDPETKDICQLFWDTLIAYNNLNKAIRVMGEYGIKKNWKTWSRITKSDFYTGTHRGIVDFCEPYVSVEDFIKFHERKPIKKTPTGRVYLFRGLIKCPECGNKLCGDSNKKSYGVYKSYRCTERCHGCTFGTSVSERRVEKFLLGNITQMLQDEIARVEIEQAKPKRKPKTNLQKLKEDLRRLTVAYRAGNVDDDEYLKEDAELKALIAKAEQEAPPEPKDIAPLKELLETDFLSLYETFNEEEKQRFWLGLIKEIKVEGKDPKGVIFF